jgi:peptide/nickel transport system substrate-binding protein
MHGEPALPAGFEHLPYANPRAPKGGRLVLGLQGTFDSLNPLVVKGVAPDALTRFVLQGLMARSLDEPFTLYGLVALSVETPHDRSAVTFRLDPRARFADGRRLTAEDVRFTFELLRRHGKPFHRASFGQVRAVEVEDAGTIRFDLAGNEDRELPLLIGVMPIFPAHAIDPERFPETMLTAPPGSGPYAVAELRPGERIVLRRRADFWAADLPVLRGLFNVDEIRYEFYRDSNSLFEAFKAGLTDFRVETDPVRWVGGYDFPAAREGRIRRESVTIATPKGMSGFVFNTRRPLFATAGVREALAACFDFEWINRNLFLGTMRRSGSYFDGSELSARGHPADEPERRWLHEAGVDLPADLLEGRWAPPVSDGTGRDREVLRVALARLGEAGWRLREGVLRQGEEAFSFEFLAVSRAQERLALAYAQSLRRIGVHMRVRSVDDVQFWRRLAAFDFDMIQWTWPVSASPGSEQRNRWSSAAADRSGSLNYAGVRSPAVDRAIDALLATEDRAGFVRAVRTLDRLLLSGSYVVPLFYPPEQWIAYDRSLKRPDRPPLFGFPLELWWREPAG